MNRRAAPQVRLIEPGSSVQCWQVAAATGRPDGPLTHCFPSAETLAAADPATLPMPRARGRALTGLAAALASGELWLDPGAERDRAEAVLLALPGIGPWTTAYIRMRALSDPDAFLPGDVGVLDALRRLGAVPGFGAVPGGRARASRSVRGSVALAEGWRPWRSYAVHHLWASLEPVTDLQQKDQP